MATFSDRELDEYDSEVQWLVRIDRAIKSRRLRLFGQPIVRLSGDAGATLQSVIGIEVLLRLAEADGSLVDPNLFVPTMEKFRMAEHLDRYVLESVSRQLSSNSAREAPSKRIFVNVSGQSISNVEFLTFAETLFSNAPHVASQLCLEITETAAVSNLASAKQFIATLKLQGCQFALDDFGSGFASFASLKDLPVDYVKIDGSFVLGVADNPVDFAIVRSFSEIGQMMGKTMIAEWAETDAMIQQLRRLSIDLFQGHAFGHPVPLDELV